MASSSSSSSRSSGSRTAWLVGGVAVAAALGVGYLAYRRHQKKTSLLTLHAPRPTTVMGNRPMKPGNPFRRLIGTVDVDRKGTDHYINSIGPMILADDAIIASVKPGEEGKGPKFTAHPHKGLITCGVMLAGAIHHSDNHGRSEIYKKDDTMWMAAGKGVVHAEVPVENGEDRRLVQIWFQDPNVTVRSEVMHVKEHPKLTWGKVEGVLSAGSFENGEGKQTARGLYPYPDTYFVLRLAIPPATTHRFPIPKTFEGAAYVASGSATFNDEFKGVEAANLLTFQPGGGRDLKITSGDSALEVIVFAGVPRTAPFFKALVNEGGVVGTSDSEVRAYREEYLAAHNTVADTAPITDHPFGK